VKLTELIDLARDYSDALDRLDEVTGEIEEEQLRAVRRRMRSLRARALVAQAAREKLLAGIGAADPALFERPRTRIAHGVKFGRRRLQGKMAMSAGQTVSGAVAAIREHLPGLLDAAVETKHTLVVAQVRKMTAEQQRLIGVSFGDPSDSPVAARVVPSAERLAAALIEGADEAEDDAA